MIWLQLSAVARNWFFIVLSIGRLYVRQYRLYSTRILCAACWWGSLSATHDIYLLIYYYTFSCLHFLVPSEPVAVYWWILTVILPNDLIFHSFVRGSFLLKTSLHIALTMSKNNTLTWNFLVSLTNARVVSVKDSILHKLNSCDVSKYLHTEGTPYSTIQ